MEQKKKRIALSIGLILAIGSYSRISGNENIRNVQIFALLAIGAIGALLIKEVIDTYKNQNNK